MNIICVHEGAEKAVNAFLVVAGRSLETFRYYAKRDVAAALKNHLVTLVGVDDANQPIAYGHLDAEGKIAWLGICVAEGHIGAGFGRQMMQALVGAAERFGVKDLRLAVDVTNWPARALYAQFDFKLDGLVPGGASAMYLKRRSKVADTVGSMVDKLITIDMKMWNNQELLYEIRRMSFEEYKAKYFTDEDGARKLWETLKKACDLNVQRSVLVTEVDERLVNMIKAVVAGKDLDDGANIQRQYKTY